eukprot:CAMPEP_0174373650 /NCGR_PEP_ID=MMETSP0811_2-20130205/108002_1 /TAXON_ID=73025 ORGANISM="Eutreptiella gymnastica-like, Strain CCMP1594" /NCGR_SAMPLE_ID=MMETSP0811_2 /ASSEMBLY_ACC=CAM_ASM_000667 /LENGTH=102 /DNA_ID=CAMNT_0015522251 /DNA_START=44 /DNA_END=353 /DNA_ORIENTATION=+
MSRNLLATSGFERHASFSKDTALDPVVVDIWLLVYAQTFVGTLASSLTANVASLRKARQKTSFPTPRGPASTSSAEDRSGDGIRVRSGEEHRATVLPHDSLV